MHCTLYIVNCSLFNTQEERLSIYWHLELNEHFQMFSTNCNFFNCPLAWNSNESKRCKNICNSSLWTHFATNCKYAKVPASFLQICNKYAKVPASFLQISNKYAKVPASQFSTNMQQMCKVASQVSTNMQQKCKDASQPVFYKIWCWHKCMIMHKLLLLICLPYILYTHLIAYKSKQTMCKYFIILLLLPP